MGEDVRIKEIVLSRTYNLGDYESLKVELRAEIDPNAHINKCLSQLERQADNYFDYRKK